VELKKKTLVKRKGVFDYLNQITKHQKKGFWESLSDEDKKGWSTFLVNRFLSMRSDFLPIVNEVQKYNLKPEMIYKTYMDIIPKGNYYLRYIKGKKKKNMDYPNWMINIVSNDLQVSKREAYDAIEMYMLTEAGQQELSELIQKFGVDKKQLKSVGLYFESSGTDIRTIG
jgi:hypothetical protein